MTQAFDFGAKTQSEKGCETLKAAKSAAAAFVIDPITTRIVAKVREQKSEKRPLRHAAMNAIDLVAHCHGGGVWPSLDFEVQKDTNEKVHIKISVPKCIRFSKKIVKLT